MTLESCRKRIARNFVVIGLGIALIYLPALCMVLGMQAAVRIVFFLTPITFLGGFYVIGLGVAGVTVGIVEIVRATSANR